MMTDTNSETDVKTLNSLLTTVVDSIDGFEQASEGVENPTITAAFAEVVSERRGIADDLEQAIRRLGGTPEEKGTILGSAHRVLIKIREAVSSGDTAVVDEAERGEDYIKGKFEKAERDDALSADARQTVTTLAGRVVAGHDRIRDLKHALHD